jgi:hypothetical protein
VVVGGAVVAATVVSAMVVLCWPVAPWRSLEAHETARLATSSAPPTATRRRRSPCCSPGRPAVLSCQQQGRTQAVTANTGIVGEVWHWLGLHAMGSSERHPARRSASSLPRRPPQSQEPRAGLAHPADLRLDGSDLFVRGRQGMMPGSLGRDGTWRRDPRDYNPNRPFASSQLHELQGR